MEVRWLEKFRSKQMGGRRVSPSDSGAMRTDDKPVPGDSVRQPPLLRKWANPDGHACALSAWLRANGYVDGSILSRDLMVLHEQMCADLGLLPRTQIAARGLGPQKASWRQEDVRLGRRAALAGVSASFIG